MKQYFCLGTYTEPILFGTGEVFVGKGEGVLICEFDDGRINILKSAMTQNPSYVCINEECEKIYTVNELKEFKGKFGGGVSQFSYKNGEIVFEASFNVMGTDPCHIEMSPNKEFISIANFASGSVTAYNLSENGDMLPQAMFFQHEGKSVHPIRQKGPHAHATVFSKTKNTFYVPDLGMDMVVAYKHNGGKIERCDEETLKVIEGSGPRSGVFSSDNKYFYLINEISSQISVYSNKETLELTQTVETLPSDFSGDNICSDIHIGKTGEYLYASNRGHDSLVVYKIQHDGKLEKIQTISCKGKTPRNFSLDNTGKYLLCGNQDSDTITVFNVLLDGMLEFKNTNNINTPVCIKFFEIFVL